MQLKQRPPAAAGFSIIEVMIALFVISIGLLGIAKLEASSIASTTVASRRSLAAIEAASMAATMHVNRGYWTQADASGATITIQNGNVAVANGPILTAAVAAAPNCASTTTPCTVERQAAYDLQQWAPALGAVLPNYVALVSCGATTPVACTINIVWSESSVAINAQEAAAQAANPNANFENPSYTLYVQP